MMTYFLRLASTITLLFFSGFSSASDTSVEQQIKICESCHGTSGVPVNTATPIIAGQEYYYIYVQLKDFKAGRRSNPIMSGMVAETTKQDMKALAEHFSNKAWPQLSQYIDDSKADSGEAALAAGQCSQCHSTYKGDSRIPRLAGQQLEYLEKTMKDFKNKVRLNSPAKGTLMNSFENEPLEAMAHHLSGL